MFRKKISSGALSDKFLPGGASTAAPVLLLSLLLAGQALPLQAQSSREQKVQTDHRQLALAMPRVSPESRKTQDRVTPVAKLSAPSAAQLSPQDEFGNHPHISSHPGRAIPDNVRAALIDGAARAEQLSRSCNRRIADLIVWLVNSLNQPTTISPAVGPNLRPARVIEARPHTGSEHAIFQID